jgi:hypothetical protein
LLLLLLLLFSLQQQQLLLSARRAEIFYKRVLNNINNTLGPLRLSAPLLSLASLFICALRAFYFLLL